MAKQKMKRELNLFDVTLLVVGSVIGSDIFVASGLTANLMGPGSLIVWIIAAVMAGVMAMAFAQASLKLPKVGGPYAYAHKAFGEFWGFMTGWALWLAEMASLAVFAVAFAKYLKFFIPLDFFSETLAKFFLIAFLTAVNYFGVKAAGRLNDALTLLKLGPLLLLILFGFSFAVKEAPTILQNYTPLLPFGLGNLGQALVLIIWAYVGFELATIPAGEIKNPSRTLHKAIIFGIAIIAFFYISTNFVIFGSVPWQQLAGNPTPLVDAGKNIFGYFGLGILTILISAGALISISGSDESGTIGTSRLAYAMAADGLFPHAFAKLHKKYKTPVNALLFQGGAAFLASLIAGITQLISFSVFTIMLAYIGTAAALIKFNKKSGGSNLVAGLTILFSAFLISQAGLQAVAVGTALMIIGIPFYIYLSPKVQLADVKKIITSDEYILEKRIRFEERFLARVLRHAFNLHQHVKRKIYEVSHGRKRFKKTRSN